MKGTNFFKEIAVGFYFTATLALLIFVAAIVYAAGFSEVEEMSWTAFALMMAVSVLSLLIIAMQLLFGLLNMRAVSGIIKRFVMPFVPFMLAASALVTLLLYASASFQMITRMSLGMNISDINFFTFFGVSLPICALIFVTTAILGTVSVFIPLFNKYTANSNASLSGSEAAY